jgi:hypothetical protein
MFAFQSRLLFFLMDGKLQSITAIFIISYDVESIAKIITICNYMFRPYRPSSGSKYFL